MHCFEVGFEKRKWFSCVLEESLVLIRKFGTKIMFLCLFLHVLLVWVPRSMFWAHGMKSHIFVTGFDLAFIFLMIMFIMNCMCFKGEPRFPRFCFWLRPTGPHLGKDVWDLGKDLAGTQCVFMRWEQCLNSQHVLLCYWLGSGEDAEIICMLMRLVLRMWFAMWFVGPWSSLWAYTRGKLCEWYF